MTCPLPFPPPLATARERSNERTVQENVTLNWSHTSCSWSDGTHGPFARSFVRSLASLLPTITAGGCAGRLFSFLFSFFFFAFACSAFHRVLRAGVAASIGQGLGLVFYLLAVSTIKAQHSTRKTEVTDGGEPRSTRPTPTSGLLSSVERAFAAPCCLLSPHTSVT